MGELIIAGLSVVVVISAGKAVRYSRLAALLTRTPVHAVGDLTSGYSMIQGEVVASDHLDAPLTRSRCAIFTTVAAVPGENADIARRWDAVHFAVDDGTRSIRLDHDEWEFISEPPAVLCDEKVPPTLELFAQVRENFPWLEDRSADGNLAASNMICRESIVRAGDTVCVAGTVVNTKSGKRFRKRPGRPVLVTDQSSWFLLSNFSGRAALCWVLAAASLAAAIGCALWTL